MPTHDPHRRARRSTPVILLLLVALLAAACGSNGPSATASAVTQPSSSPTAPAASPSSAATASAPAPSASTGAQASADPATDAIYDAIEAQVAAIRGLNPNRPVERQFLTTDELKTMLTQQFDEDSPPAYVAATSRLYKALGLIPADADLRTLTLDLLGGGVAGFYRNDQGKLYVVSKTGSPGAPERFYFAHEFDHALQDQNTTVFKDQDGVLDQSDRILARAAAYEGDATLLMTLWGIQNLTPEDIQELLALGNDPETKALLARTPPILRTPLEFPYDTGATWVQGIYGDGGWPAVDAVYKRMPESTEQILHPEKYTAAEAPVKVAIPADLATRLGSGWTVPLQDTLGELQTRIWLSDTGAAGANAAAAGWGGDRLAVAEGPNGAWAVVMQTAWDTAKDAAEFETAAKTAVKEAGGAARVLPGSGDKTRWVLVANDDATLGKVANVLGLAG
jgi:hypothetical protein